MAKTISSLLVGIGLDFNEKSTRGVESSFDRVKSSALKLGAIVAGAFGVNQLTSGFAASNDALGKFSETYGVVANDVAAFDRALQKSGGLPGSFLSQLEGLERLRAATKVGDFGFIEAASKAGIDTRAIIDATSATEAYLALADQFAGSDQQQRLNMADAIGLDDASIRLLGTGKKSVSALVAAEKSRRPVTTEMLEMSAKFNRQWIDLNTNIGRVADTVSVKLLPHINDLLVGFNDWMESNKAFIDGGFNDFLEAVADNLGLIAVGFAALSAPAILGTMKAVGKVGLSVGATAVKAGLPAAAGVGGYYAGGQIYDKIPEDTQTDIGRGVAQVLSFFGNEEATKALEIERVTQAVNVNQAANISQVTTQTVRDIGPRTDDSQKLPDIYLTNKTIIDGRVIEDVTRRVLDASASTMADELSSSVR